MISPLSKGKFKRAIAMSGSAFSTSLPSTPDIHPYKNTNCEDSKSNRDLIECLRNIKALPLVEDAWNKYEWGPVVDFNFLPKRPEEFFQAAEHHKVCSIKFNATYFI
jgi:carboxylesterase type B